VVSHKVSVKVLTFSMVSLMAKFVGGPLQPRAQTRVGWFLTSRRYISKTVQNRAYVTINH